MTDETLLTVPEVALRLRCTRKTVHNLILNGRLPGALRLDRVFRIPADALKALEVAPICDLRNAAQRRLAVLDALKALEVAPVAPSKAVTKVVPEAPAEPVGKPRKPAKVRKPRKLRKPRRRARRPAR